MKQGDEAADVWSNRDRNGNKRAARSRQQDLYVDLGGGGVGGGGEGEGRDGKVVWSERSTTNESSTRERKTGKRTR